MNTIDSDAELDQLIADLKALPEADVERQYWIDRAKLAATDPAQWSAKELKNVIANLLRVMGK